LAEKSFSMAGFLYMYANYDGIEKTTDVDKMNTLWKEQKYVDMWLNVKTIQSQVWLTPIKEMNKAIKKFKAPKFKDYIKIFTKGILISSDNYVIDGHHRWAALKILRRFLVDTEMFNFIEDFDTIHVTRFTDSFKEYYNKIMDHHLVFCVDLNDKYIIKIPFNFKARKGIGGGKKKRTKRRTKRTRRIKRRTKRIKI